MESIVLTLKLFSRGASFVDVDCTLLRSSIDVKFVFGCLSPSICKRTVDSLCKDQGGGIKLKLPGRVFQLQRSFLSEIAKCVKKGVTTSFKFLIG